jgi:GT2 family glycosyltransferase/glycosyltransferase involved in cell wall biosynthesis
MRIFEMLPWRNSKAESRLAEEIELLHNSPLLDPVWYRQKYADLRNTPIDVARHYLEHGAREGRNPGPLFDTKFYLEQNPDVAATGINPVVHYVLYGAKEGRDPYPRLVASTVDETLNGNKTLISPSGAIDSKELSDNFETGVLSNGFQSAAYAAQYPDVRAHIGDDPRQLFEHWCTYGWKEGRIPFGLFPYRIRTTSSAFWQRRDAITFYGFFDAQSGLGSASRAYRAALLQAGYTISSVTVSAEVRDGRFETSPDVRAESSEVDVSKRNKINIFFLNADMIHRFFWDRRLHILDDSFNIGIWAWELAHFRPDWASTFGALDEIWVLSDFCRESVSSISPVPVITMPIPVEIKGEGDLLPRSYFRLADDVFIFGCFFDVGSTVERKNPELAVRAFIAAFGEREDVLLVLKYHGAHHYPDDVKKLHALTAGRANIRFFGRIFNDQELISFKSMIDCVVSPHRSEGFGLNLTEALLLGKTVIATNYSGNVDFMDDEDSYPVAYRLVELEKECGPYPPGALWAEPDFDDFVAKLGRVVVGRSEAEARARQGKERILRNYSTETIGNRLKARLDELEILSGRGKFTKSWKAGVNFTYQYITTEGPKISVVVPVYDIEPSLLAKCVNSVVEQTYQNWELILHDDGSTRPDTITEVGRYKGIDPRLKVSFGAKNHGIAEATNAAIAFSSGEFIAFLDNDDELAPTALAEMAAAIQKNKDVDLLYSDEDKIDLDGSYCDHYYKPDWSPEHLESVMYLLHLLVARRSILLSIGGLRTRFSGAQDYDLALRVSRVARNIVHVPKILYHWRKIPGSAAAQVDAKPYGLERGKEALQDYLYASGRDAVVVPGLLPGLFRVRDAIRPGLPVTLAIVAGNRVADVAGRGMINIFDHFLNSILERTKTSCSLRILAVDDANFTQAQRLHVSRNGGEVVSYDGSRSPFNFSRKVNFALKHVKTELVILLNDDMEVISPDWVDALVELAQRPTTGAVGARLLYADNRVQHCGIVLGINGHAAHVYHQAPADRVGYNAYTHLIRNYLAVTGACMAIRMSLIDEVGGFDEALAVEYNDIDFCLRLHSAGYRNVYTPFSQLYHFEGTSLKRTNINETDHQLFAQRWRRYLNCDPFYNPNLTRQRLDFSQVP